VPADLWAGVRDPKLKNPNPVVMTRAVAKTSSSQLVELLLCTTCEDRLNKNGEIEDLLLNYEDLITWLASAKLFGGSNLTRALERDGEASRPLSTFLNKL
jgi:hypothetical protein